MEMCFPVVDSYVTDMRRAKIRCNVEKLPELVIEVTQNPVEVFVMPQVGVRFGNVGKLNFETVTLDREEFYAAHSFQTTLFEITRIIVNILTDQSAKDPNVRNISRAELFPQVLKIVEEYTDKRVVWNGVNKRELALERYSRPVVERLVGAIEPETADQEPPILPVINRFTPRGSTENVHFVTTRTTHPTIKSHIDQVVLDTDTWERSVAFQLEASPHVAFYARNDHLELSIPYEFLGVSHAFFPDFIVRLNNGVTLVLEVKGMVDEQERAKFAAAERWVRAINYWGKMGRWEFLVCKDPNSLRPQLEHFAKEEDVAA